MTGVRVRGWLECSGSQVPEITQIVDSFVTRAEDYDLTEDAVKACNRGWVFPKGERQDQQFVFFGACLADECLGLMRSQLRKISSIGTPPYGLFHADSPERQSLIWKISNGLFAEKERNK